MNQYIFIHGKNASLSQTELRAVYGEHIQTQTSDFTLTQSNQKISQSHQDRLGGTIKICELIKGDLIEDILKSSKTEKILFGVSQYGGHQRLSELLMNIKKDLKNTGKNCRFLNKNFSNISSGQLNKSKVLDKGIDLVLCQSKGQTWWAKTITFQNIDAYSKRDYEKPKRDMKVGMMPPKLAQIMINLALAKPGSTIYDPFCGLGTTLMEAVLMGYQAMGSDIKGRLVNNSIQNLQWLMKEFNPKENPTHLEKKIFQHDATQPFPKSNYPKDISVVTEGYLGPLLSSPPSPERQTEIFSLLDDINSRFFSHISQIIPFGKKLIISLPYFKKGSDQIFYPEEFIIKYSQKNSFDIENDLRSLLYERQNQVVGREIMIFKKV